MKEIETKKKKKDPFPRHLAPSTFSKLHVCLPFASQPPICSFSPASIQKGGHHLLLRLLFN